MPLWAFVVMAGVTLRAPLAAQSVQIENLTRQGQTTDWWVGDSFTLTISGAAYQLVQATGIHDGVQSTTPFGYTDGNGQYVSSGTMGAEDNGSWTEIWYVGNNQATPTLSFKVRNVPPCPGTKTADNLYSVDSYHSGETYPYQQWLGSGWASGSISDTSVCHFTNIAQVNDPWGYVWSTSWGVSNSYTYLAYRDGGTWRSVYNSYPLADYFEVDLWYQDAQGNYHLSPTYPMLWITQTVD